MSVYFNVGYSMSMHAFQKIDGMGLFHRFWEKKKIELKDAENFFQQVKRLELCFYIYKILKLLDRISLEVYEIYWVGKCPCNVNFEIYFPDAHYSFF